MNLNLTGQDNRGPLAQASLRDKVDCGEISAKEAAEGPIINPNALNHAHSRKKAHRPGVQLDLF